MRLRMIALCFVEHQLRIEGFRFEASDPSTQANPADPSVIASQGMRPCRPPIGKAWLHLAPDHQLLEGSPKHPRVIVLRGSAAARQGTFARSRMGSWAIVAGGRW